MLKGSKMVFEGAPVVRFLVADVVLMHAMGSVLMPWQSEVTAKRRSNQTYVVVRLGVMRNPVLAVLRPETASNYPPRRYRMSCKLLILLK